MRPWICSLGNIFFDISKVRKSSRRGLWGKIFDKLRIQCRIQIFEKMSQSALNHVLILQKDRTQKVLQIPLKIIDLQNAFPTQNTILPAQKAPAGCFFGSKYNFIRPKGPCERPLRDTFSAQNTILSAQKAPAGRFFCSKYNFIHLKGPCGTLFRLKMQFYPPKRLLRDDLL